MTKLEFIKKWAPAKTPGSPFYYAEMKADLDALEQRLLLSSEAEKGEEYDPYWYWPQCDVEGCEGVSCNGGGCWRDTGYWSVCPIHAQQFRDGKPQPRMKQSAIDKEATRLPDGTLPPSPPSAQEKQGVEVSSKIDAKRLLEILLQYEAKMNEEIISLVKQNQ